LYRNIPLSRYPFKAGLKLNVQRVLSPSDASDAERFESGSTPATCTLCPACRIFGIGGSADRIPKEGRLIDSVGHNLEADVYVVFYSYPSDRERVDYCDIERGLSTDSHRRLHHHRCRHGIVITIAANVENRSRSHWNRVHVPLESAFTIS
jgi:hypothetical protein